ncbi:MAG: ribosome-associated translation inhibitor RaiA [bacterium]|nr:ribosome-associated translation inhibitor RaiA [bacterium]
MHIDIQARDLELTDPLKEYATKRVGSLERYLSRFDQGLIMAEVELARTTKHHYQGDVYYAEVNLTLPGKLLRATHTSSDIRQSIDKVRDTLQREIRKFKDQLES